MKSKRVSGQKQDSSKSDIESQSRFESLETYLTGLKEKLKEDFGEKADSKNWLIGGPQAARITGHLAGLGESSIRRIYETVRNKRVFGFVDPEIGEATVLQLGKDQTLALGAVCYFFSKNRPNPRKPVENWEAIFTETKKALNRLYPELAVLILNPRKPDVKSKPGSGQNSTNNKQDFFRHIDYENVAEPGLSESLKRFQRSAQLRLGSTVGVNSAVELVGKCLDPNFSKEGVTWLDSLFWECVNRNVLKLSHKNSKESLESMDDLYKFFILGWVNKRRFGFKRIGNRELTQIIDEAQIALGGHKYVFELENIAISSDKDSVEEEYRKEYCPSEQTLKLAENWDKVRLSEALDSLCGISNSNVLDGIDSFENILPVRIAELLTYIFSTLQRRDFSDFKQVFVNLNVRGSKEIVKFCLFMFSEEIYKVKNLRQLYERTEGYKKSPHYLNPQSS